MSFKSENYDILAQPIAGCVHFGRQAANNPPNVSFDQAEQNIRLRFYNDRGMCSDIKCVLERTGFSDYLQAISRDI